MDFQKAFDDGWAAVKRHLDGWKAATEAAFAARIAELIPAAVKALPQAEPASEAQIALAVRSYLDAHLAIGLPDLKSLVDEAVAALPPPAAGKDVDMDQVCELIAAEVAKLPPPAAGKDADPEEIQRLVVAAVEALPPPAAGKDVDIDQVRELIAAEVAKLPPPAAGKDADPEEIQRLVVASVEALPPPAAGKDVDMEQVREFIVAELATWPKPKDGASVDLDKVSLQVRAAVAEILESWPKPQDGKSVEPGEIQAMVKAAVDALPPAKDGLGLAGAMLGREGQLMVTLTNGVICDLGPVVGRDADPAEIERQIRAAFEAIPAPKNGKDGFNLEDFDIDQKDDGRTLVFKFKRGDYEHTFELEFPVVIDRGVWREGAHAKGDAVTWAGNLWIAQKATELKPGDNDDWRLAVRRGRDGKDLTSAASPAKTGPISVGVPSRPAGEQ